ncbi:hypothetical protein BGX21_001032 [Mortierella sp. AD011]|nr:hypothetical protein BGX20_009639 [Mortierella sp. AD010]KAF9403659.1 hypothetical protein BGX21_001032 [Mortierella sp. AD011]
MSWLAKNVGSLASRIAAEANGDNQYGNNEILQQLNQQLLETREELSERHQEWERAKQNYEARLKSLTEGNATAQKVEQLEHKLNRAVELLKTLNNEKQNLNAKIKALEAEKKEAEAAAAAAAAEVAAVQAEIYNDGLSNVDRDHENAGNERIQDLEAELKAEKEQHSLFVQAHKDQLSILTETNEGLKAQLAGHQEEIDAQAGLSIQLELTKEELEQAKNEIATLKENNAKLASQAEAEPQSPSQHPSSPALAKELMDAKSIIAELEARLSKESERTAEISILKASQKELQDTLATLHEELKQSKENHSEAQNELNNSKEANATLEESKVSMSETIAQLNSKLETLRISDVEVKKLLEQYEEEKRTLLASCDSLRQELEEMKSKYEEHVVLAASPNDTDQEKLKEEFEDEKRMLLAIQDGLNKELEALRKKCDEDCLAAEGALKERELTIHDLQKTVATNKEVLKSVEEDLQRTVNERSQLQSQHNTLLDRIANMKSTLGTKLQADMENINIQRQQIDQLTEQNNSYIQTIKQLEEELMASHEHYEKTSRELEHLRRHMDDIKEDAFSEVVEKENLLQELQSRLQREEREREDWETMASEQRASKDHAVMNMRAMERERDAARAEKEVLRQELNREIESLNNLQTVLEEFQSTKESEIQFALEGLQRELKAANSSLEESRNRAQAAEEQLHHLTLDVEKARQLEREVKEKNQLIGKLRHDAVIQQGHLTEAMRRLKEENNQNTVDIPLISNLFISFLNIPRGDQKRFEILQLISGVLKFTDEQREQAGLIRKAGGLGAMTPTTSGSRSPSMEQMRQHQEPKEPLQIHWHDKQPIYSAHFEPGPKGRLATAGGDGNVRIWRVVKDKEKDSTHIEFLSSLNRHTAAVNVVRFSPTVECLASAGDDGNIILWRPSEIKEAANRFAESDEEEYERETWRVQSMMRGSLSDIYDLAWSPDGRFIISGSIDNTARIWDVKDAKCIHVITDHHHYVQGVAWDPLGEFVATQSSDRIKTLSINTNSQICSFSSVNIYAFKVNKSGLPSVSILGKSTKLDLTKLRSTPQPSTPVAIATPPPNIKTSVGGDDVKLDAPIEKDDASKPTKPSPKSFRLYHDETLTSFFRRLSFTPDGSMLITPAGQYKATTQKPIGLKDEDVQPTLQPSEQETRNTVYVYARRDFSKGPVAHLPGQKKPSVAIKCSPVLYELRDQLRPKQISRQALDKQNSANGGHGTATSQADEKNPSLAHTPSVFGLGYRSIYAVATQDSILIYDTQQATALALVSHLHYATFTDMAWSSDGCNLILTSTDGFCSIISFEEGELGTVYTPSKSMMALLSTHESAAMTQNDSLDSAATVAATAGMLQKLNSLSLAEQKEQKELKELKEQKEQQKTKSKPEKGAPSEGKKSVVKQLFSKSRSLAASRPSVPSSLSSSSSPVLSNAVPKNGKTERDGDSVMSSANEQPTPKKRRIQPTFVSALPGSTSATTPSSPVAQSPSPSTLSAPPASTGNNINNSDSSNGGAPPKKRIQPTFVSALPGC